jgi:5-methyltetrahydropteroyltriglutamate--homocysteine methyltransferase
MRKPVDVLIPTTMVGSYPRPRWYTRRAGGQDFREALMEQVWREEYQDGVQAIIGDQERAGLDIVTDGELFEDDLGGGAGWPEYVVQRLTGLGPRQAGQRPGARDPSPIVDHFFLDVWASPTVAGQVGRGPLRFAYLYELASRLTSRPVKASFVDPGYVANRLHDRHYGGAFAAPHPDLLYDLAAVYNEELRELADAGCRIYQTDLPLYSQIGMTGGPVPWEVATKAFNQMVEGTTDRMQVWMHYCRGRAYGQSSWGEGDFRPMLPRVFDANFHVLNVECGDCLGPEMEILSQMPADRDVAIGIVNHRILQVETPQEVAGRIRRALQHIAPERLYVTTFCGLGTTMPRTNASFKLKALVDGANIVRAELTGRPELAASDAT